MPHKPKRSFGGLPPPRPPLPVDRGEFMRRFDLVEIPATDDNLIAFLEGCFADLQDREYEPLFPIPAEALRFSGSLLNECRVRGIRRYTFPSLEIFARDGMPAAFAIHSKTFPPGIVRMMGRFTSAGYDLIMQPQSWKGWPGITCIVANPADVQLSAMPDAFKLRV